MTKYRHRSWRIKSTKRREQRREEKNLSQSKNGRFEPIFIHGQICDIFFSIFCDNRLTSALIIFLCLYSLVLFFFRFYFILCFFFHWILFLPNFVVCSFCYEIHDGEKEKYKKRR